MGKGGSVISASQGMMRGVQDAAEGGKEAFDRVRTVVQIEFDVAETK